MQATGIVRRIDDLGRVVIPRDLRRKLNIKEGDPLEIFLDDEGVLFKPYHTEDPDRELFSHGERMIAALDKMFDGNNSDTDYQLSRLALEKIIQEYGKKN